MLYNMLKIPIFNSLVKTALIYEQIHHHCNVFSLMSNKIQFKILYSTD